MVVSNHHWQFINGQGINQVYRAVEGAANTWESFDGKDTFTLNSPLTLSDENGATIILKDSYADPTQTILAYQDFDPVAEGIQTQTDSLGNLIQIPGQVEAQEDHLFGSEDTDHIQSGTLNDLVEGKGGDDRIEGGGDTDILVGGAGDDRLYADNEADFADTFDSDDTPAGSTRDCLAGGDGDDQLIGSTGGDALSGGC